jgi:hypothetical protein
MASKYVTDDGLDLDSRYLGINAKAKSAETADTATSITWESVSDKPEDLSHGAYITVAYVSANPSGSGNRVSYTVPKNCLATVSVSGRYSYPDDYLTFTLTGGFRHTDEGDFSKGRDMPGPLFLAEGTVVTATLSRNSTVYMRLNMRQFANA